MSRPPSSTPPAPAWPALVSAALVCTLTAGALTGAFDLWSLRVLQRPVPLDHHRAHGFAQLFGFVLLFIIGLSQHLVPRFLGAPAAAPRSTRALKWTAIAGVVLLVAGRLGRLVPGSEALGLLGAIGVLMTTTGWLRFLVAQWRRASVPHDGLPRFLLAGGAWWWVAAATLLAWHLGQAFAGPAAAISLDAVWAAALFGGAGSCLWGIFLRPGLATLRLGRPGATAEWAWFLTWQLAAGCAFLSGWSPSAEANAVAAGAAVVAVAAVALALRPFGGEPPVQTGAFQARAMQLALGFVFTFGALEAWAVCGAFGAWTPPLLADAARHVFTLGGVTLFILGFGGRMVPGFRGVALRWPWAYDAGLVGVAASAALRLGELWPGRVGQTLAGASAAFGALGVALAASALLGTLRLAPGQVAQLPRAGTGTAATKASSG